MYSYALKLSAAVECWEGLWLLLVGWMVICQRTGKTSRCFCWLSRGIPRFSHRTIWCKYLNGLKRMGVSKEPSYLFASEITNGVAAMVEHKRAQLWQQEGTLFSSPHISFMCQLCVVVAKDLAVTPWFGVSGWRVFVPQEGEAQEHPQWLELHWWAVPGVWPLPRGGCGGAQGLLSPSGPSAMCSPENTSKIKGPAC